MKCPTLKYWGFICQNKPLPTNKDEERKYLADTEGFPRFYEAWYLRSKDNDFDDGYDGIESFR